MLPTRSLSRGCAMYVKYTHFTMSAHINLVCCKWRMWLLFCPFPFITFQVASIPKCHLLCLSLCYHNGYQWHLFVIFILFHYYFSSIGWCSISNLYCCSISLAEIIKFRNAFPLTFSYPLRFEVTGWPLKIHYVFKDSLPHMSEYVIYWNTSTDEDYEFPQTWTYMA